MTGSASSPSCTHSAAADLSAFYFDVRKDSALLRPAGQPASRRACPQRCSTRCIAALCMLAGPGPVLHRRGRLDRPVRRSRQRAFAGVFLPGARGHGRTQTLGARMGKAARRARRHHRDAGRRRCARDWQSSARRLQAAGQDASRRFDQGLDADGMGRARHRLAKSQFRKPWRRTSAGIVGHARRRAANAPAAGGCWRKSARSLRTAIRCSACAAPMRWRAAWSASRRWRHDADAAAPVFGLALAVPWFWRWIRRASSSS